MTDRIEPALTAEEWEEHGGDTVDGYIDWDVMIVDVNAHHAPDRSRFIPGLIALANDALKPDDKRKITRETVAMLRRAGAPSNLLNDPYESDPVSPYAAELNALAAALASYLPPE